MTGVHTSACELIDCERSSRWAWRACLGLALVVWLFGASTVLAATERIVEYRSDIQVLADASMEVVETIVVWSQGEAIKRGIYRDFPLRYRTASGVRVTVGFEIISVRRDDLPQPWFTEPHGDGVRIYVGHKDVLIGVGEHRYEITYRTWRQLGFFEQHDELYWNVTGNGWALPIDQVSAYVYLPKTVPDSTIHTEAYSGQLGERKADYDSGVDEDGVAWYATTRGFVAGEGLTIVATWPKGHVRMPNGRDRAMWFVQDNGHLLLAVVGVGVLLSYYLVVWVQVGRDPRGGVIFPRYEPPSGYSPASMRYIERMGYDNKVFVAALVNLAVNGHIEIDERGGRYTVRSKSSDTPLAPGERALLKTLMKSGDEIVLEQSQHRTIAAAIDAHKARLAADYERKYFNTNTRYSVAGMIISLLLFGISLFVPPGPDEFIASAFLLLWLSVWTFAVIVLLLAVLRAWRGANRFKSRASAMMLSAFTVPFVAAWFVGAGLLLTLAGPALFALVITLMSINAVFYHLMKAPTLMGRELLDVIAGFREYMGLAEADELRLANPPRKTPQLFERLLAYAIALDVEGVWGERFRHTLETAKFRNDYHGPNWYRSADGISIAALGSALGSSLASSVSAASSAPGSSSGSGGGGSSGGGGGGGGGGGW